MCSVSIIIDYLTISRNYINIIKKALKRRSIHFLMLREGLSGGKPHEGDEEGSLGAVNRSNSRLYRNPTVMREIVSVIYLYYTESGLFIEHKARWYRGGCKPFVLIWTKGFLHYYSNKYRRSEKNAK